MLHRHCETCIKPSTCRSKSAKQAVNGVADETQALNGHTVCPLVSCDNRDCPQVMHKCKLQEHLIICHHQKTQCLNWCNGCPALVYRKDMSRHLLHCSANVIHCTVEWNRWPIHTRERRLTSQMSQLLPQSLNVNHLDVALALRDQRMLRQLWTAKKCTQKAFKNYLTLKYPAVPLKPYRGLHLTDKTNTNGDQSPHSSSVSPTNSQSTRAQSPEESDESSESSPWLTNRSPPGLQSSVCAKLLDTGHQTQAPNTGIKCHTNKLDFSAAVEPSDELTANSTVTSGTIPIAPALPQCNSLSLDINVRTIAAYQKKPKLMYTFRCAQEFRRDEYEWHYRNVHNDIHGGIDGWIEHRCPLWQYGCNFVHRRWTPKPDGASIVFNELVENFGIKMPETEADVYSDSQAISISLLPFEILQNICQHLDSFSLNNLSLTSKRLRDVCRTFLDTRGLVSLQWQRSVNENGKYSWDVGYKLAGGVGGLGAQQQQQQLAAGVGGLGGLGAQQQQQQLAGGVGGLGAQQQQQQLAAGVGGLGGLGAQQQQQQLAGGVGGLGAQQQQQQLAAGVGGLGGLGAQQQQQQLAGGVGGLGAQQQQQQLVGAAGTAPVAQQQQQQQAAGGLGGAQQQQQQQAAISVAADGSTSGQQQQQQQAISKTI
ncbi:unnamed protein product [Oppiella nova]|uniref:F-box domain-containing protein n=1 Tax=Oppiella nova TaxID=334625 RepID=A0A7R9M349_9ACAR|nr:unnamed protein product [Oppiella nova]CAG2169917.1 unnamed protein product [Oppiella nova]